MRENLVKLPFYFDISMECPGYNLDGYERIFNGMSSFPRLKRVKEFRKRDEKYLSFLFLLLWLLNCENPPSNSPYQMKKAPRLNLNLLNARGMSRRNH